MADVTCRNCAPKQCICRTKVLAAVQCLEIARRGPEHLRDDALALHDRIVSGMEDDFLRETQVKIQSIIQAMHN